MYQVILFTEAADKFKVLIAKKQAYLEEYCNKPQAKDEVIEKLNYELECMINFHNYAMAAINALEADSETRCKSCYKADLLKKAKLVLKSGFAYNPANLAYQKLEDFIY